MHCEKQPRRELHGHADTQPGRFPPVMAHGWNPSVGGFRSDSICLFLGEVKECFQFGIQLGGFRSNLLDSFEEADVHQEKESAAVDLEPHWLSCSGFD